QTRADTLEVTEQQKILRLTGEGDLGGQGDAYDPSFDPHPHRQFPSRWDAPSASPSSAAADAPTRPTLSFAFRQQSPPPAAFPSPSPPICLPPSPRPSAISGSSGGSGGRRRDAVRT